MDFIGVPIKGDLDFRGLWAETDRVNFFDLVWSCTYHHDMKRLSMNMPDDLHKRLKRYCVEADKDMTDVVLKLIEEFLAKAEIKTKR